jgi:ubiquinone/menaquinone biosynthesis C-methylase UbiE
VSSSRGESGPDEAGARRASSLIASAYDRTAADFARYADALVYRHLAALLAARIGDVDGPVLDVASGTGALARLLPGAVAVDASVNQLVHNDAALKIAGDAVSLPFRSRSFAAAGCAFGINHFPDPVAAVTEIARVARVVGVTTWARPDAPYAPKDIVLGVVERHAGRYRTEAGEVIDALSDEMGSVAAIESVLRGAGLDGHAEEVAVEVPWPGAASFVDYRMSATGVMHDIDDVAAARREAIAALERLRPEQLRWRPRVVVGIGRHSA